MENGQLRMKSQLNEYRFRSEEIEDMSFIQYMLDTYETEQKKRRPNNEDAQMEDNKNEGDDEDGVCRGRKEHAHYEYKPKAKKGNKCRILCTIGHETLPQFIGK